jgi:hypothetical protein
VRDGALVWSGDKFRSGPFPSLLHGKRWPSDQENIAKHPPGERCPPGPAWFSDRERKENHPGCVRSVASRHFLEAAATPPCCEARRGMATPVVGSELFGIHR